MKLVMDSQAAVDGWTVVNDGVMGGLSQGFVQLNGDHMTFSGTVNTNGGGFTSIRHGVKPSSLRGADGVVLRLRPDDRDYSVTFRTGQTWRGRSIFWQTDLPQLAPGEWADVEVPFSALRATVFGRDVRGGEFDRGDIREIGLIIADGVDGSFSIDVASVSCETG